MLQRCLALGLTLAAAACGPVQPSREATLANEIVAAAQLPEGANPAGTSSQFFAWDEGGNIAFVFVDQRRENAAEHIARLKRSCKQAGLNTFPCNHARFGLLKPGERLWVPTPYHLPIIFDAGCSLIKGLYDVRAKRVHSIRCNGTL